MIFYVVISITVDIFEDAKIRQERRFATKQEAQCFVDQQTDITIIVPMSVNLI